MPLTSLSLSLYIYIYIYIMISSSSQMIAISKSSSIIWSDTFSSTVSSQMTFQTSNSLANLEAEMIDKRSDDCRCYLIRFFPRLTKTSKLYCKCRKRYGRASKEERYLRLSECFYIIYLKQILSDIYIYIYTHSHKPNFIQSPLF